MATHGTSLGIGSDICGIYLRACWFNWSGLPKNTLPMWFPQSRKVNTHVRSTASTPASAESAARALLSHPQVMIPSQKP